MTDALPRYIAAADLNCSGTAYAQGETVDTTGLTPSQVQFLLTWKRIVAAPADETPESPDADAG
jgi:hypothetical protein